MMFIIIIYILGRKYFWRVVNSLISHIYSFHSVVTFLTHRSQSQVTCLIESFILNYTSSNQFEKLAPP